MGVLLIKLGVRFVVFTAVFWLAAKKNKKVVINPKWVTPIVAAVFALLNTVLYWALKPVLNLATMGAVGFIMPFIINVILLVLTVRLVQQRQREDAKKSDKPRRQWLKIDGLMATLWMAIVLTIAHGVLWFAVDYLPAHL